MSEKRITKGWTHFGSNNLDIHNAKSRAERVKADKTANNLIRNVKTLSVEDLVKVKRKPLWLPPSRKEKKPLQMVN